MPKTETRNLDEVPENLQKWIQHTWLHSPRDVAGYFGDAISYTEEDFLQMGYLSRFSGRREQKTQQSDFEKHKQELYDYLSQSGLNQLFATQPYINGQPQFRYANQVRNFERLFGISPEDLDLQQLLSSLSGPNVLNPISIDGVIVQKNEYAPQFQSHILELRTPFHRFYDKAADYTKLPAKPQELTDWNSIQLLPTDAENLQTQKQLAKSAYDLTEQIQAEYNAQFANSPTFAGYDFPALTKRRDDLVALVVVGNSSKELAEELLLNQSVRQKVADYYIAPRKEFFAKHASVLRKTYGALFDELRHKQALAQNLYRLRTQDDS
jgi:hypothetical protein